MRAYYKAGGQVDKKSMACNKPRRTPSHPKKSHVVKACEGGKEKIIRFGEQGASTAGKPKKGESARMKAKRKILLSPDTLRILLKARVPLHTGLIRRNGDA
jgi:hypothetical protein